MAKSLEFLELDFHDPKEVMIAISFGSVDYRDIGKRKGTFSKTIKMPSTKVNDAFFGYSFDVNNTGHFDNKIRVPIVISEIEFNGTLQLKSVEIINGNVSSYSVNIFSDIADWVTLIGESTLRDLTHHESHILTLDNVKNSWQTNGLTGDYVYGLINYGNFLQDLPSTHNIDIAFWRPAFYSLPIVRQIFKESGYTFIDNGVKRTPFRDHILPFTSKEVEIPSLDVKASNINLPGKSIQNDSSNSIKTTKFNFGYESEESDNGNFFTHTTGVFLAPSNDMYDFNLSTVIDVFSQNTKLIGGNNREKLGDISINLVRISDGAVVASLSDPTNYGAFSGGGGKFEELNLFGGVSISLTKGQSYRVVMVIRQEEKSNVVIQRFPNATIEIKPRLSTLVEGAEIEHSKFIQNIKKIDFLNDFIKQGNFRIVTNNRNKTVEFVEESKFLLQDSEEWSGMIDQSKPSVISHIQNEGAKELVWSYSNDSDDSFIKDHSDRLDVEWGTKRVELDSEYRKGVSTVHQSIFSSTIDGTGIGLKMPVMSTQEIKQGEPILRSDFETNFENRCLIYGGLKDGDFVINGEAHTQYPFCYFVSEDFSLQWDNLGDFFDGSNDVGLVDRYYSNSIDRFNNAKLLTTWVNLNELDISNLSFRKIKSVNGSHYYLNKVTDYLVNNNQPTKVELISR
jgi:hypothetical protein